MAFLDRGPVRLSFDAVGPSTGDHPTLILTTGFGATSKMFSATAAALSDRARVVTWDLRGHGATAVPDDHAQYSVEVAVGDIMAMADHLGEERVVLGGHSLGGYLSLEAARRFPERVSALVLIGTGPGFRDDQARARWNRMVDKIATRIEERGLDGLAGSEELADARHTSAVGLVLAARGILVQHDARVLEAVPSLTMPALVLVGEHDTDFHAGASFLAAKLPDARHVVIPDAGHAPSVSRPDEFNRVLAEFLDELGARER